MPWPAARSAAKQRLQILFLGLGGSDQPTSVGKDPTSLDGPMKGISLQASLMRTAAEKYKCSALRLNPWSATNAGDHPLIAWLRISSPRRVIICVNQTEDNGQTLSLAQELWEKVLGGAANQVIIVLRCSPGAALSQVAEGLETRLAQMIGHMDGLSSNVYLTDCRCTLSHYRESKPRGVRPRWQTKRRRDK